MSKLTVFALLCAVAAAQTPVNLSGVWEHNRAASPPARQAPESMRVKIDQQGANIEITYRVIQRGNLEQMSNRYTVGQETKGEMHGAPMTSRTEWDGSALVVRSVAMIMGKELKMTDRYTLSADGNTLTMRERHQYGDEPEAEDTHVLDRRPAASWEPDKPPAPAEAVYKNIQIMKGVPAPRLRAAMLNLTTWLGVECAYCHVMGQFEKDDKPAKETARKMFIMVRAINHDNFPSSNAVTCYTCHHGMAKPQNLPAK